MNLIHMGLLTFPASAIIIILYASFDGSVLNGTLEVPISIVGLFIDFLFLLSVWRLRPLDSLGFSEAFLRQQRRTTASEVVVTLSFVYIVILCRLCFVPKLTNQFLALVQAVIFKVRVYLYTML